MKLLRYGSPPWKRFLAGLPRAGVPRPALAKAVARILAQVRRDGDAALMRLTKRFDGVSLSERSLRVSPQELRTLARRADRSLVAALQEMAERIEAFHRHQRQSGFTLRAADGSELREVVRPLESAALYVPGGAGAYPSSVLMNAIPARVAGVTRLVVVTPPRTLEANPAVAAAILIAGCQDCVYRVGGAQAVAACAYGTRSLPAVAKIVGPGNAYVAEAKRQVRGLVEIDQQAGPSEVAILADDSADAGLVSADLLAQAEHGSGEETAVLMTTSQPLAEEVLRLLALGLPTVANPKAAGRALARHGALVLVRDLDQGVVAINALAPEHAAVMTRRADKIAERVVAGAVFVGAYSPVAVGDYGIGPNHVLPTGGSARYSSPLSVRDFERRQSLVRLSRQGLGRVTEGMVRVAMAEGFRGHAVSLLTRFEGDKEGQRGF
ncbi:MAG TPA: histidinol dehydrogenase [Vicinamibacteria bacterium]|nr:histidinol dehydrogenase [Vicinamibacteria bacterium]